MAALSILWSLALGGCATGGDTLADTGSTRMDSGAGECMTGSTRACYSGPMGTQNVGLCRGGTQTCASGRWGACAGEVVPSPREACGNAMDDNCNGMVDEGCSGGDAGADGGGTNNCASNTTCGACGAVDGCGWCTNVNQCVPGSSTGPTNTSTCSGTQWVWTSDMCPAPADPCRSLSTCDGCASMDGCGWCRNTNACRVGTSSGSGDGMCTGSNWVWIPANCASTTTDPCASNATCSTCTANNGCGFCNDRHVCLSGTETGPNNGACTGSNWAWTSDMCAASTPAACAAVNVLDRTRNCAACIGAGAASGAECGWCRTTNMCVGRGAPDCPSVVTSAFGCFF